MINFFFRKHIPSVTHYLLSRFPLQVRLVSAAFPSVCCIVLKREGLGVCKPFLQLTNPGFPL